MGKRLKTRGQNGPRGFCFTLRGYSLGVGRLVAFLVLTVVGVAICNGSMAEVRVGAARQSVYLPLLEGKRVGLVCNQTSVVDGEHVADLLLWRGVSLEVLFTPEHGFAGQADAGAAVPDGRDAARGVRIVSLYGANKRPRESDIAALDVVVFDLQDVGVRCYTYISTLHYVMEACARAGVQLVVLDRPNPNGFYVDGPVLGATYRSFVGMHPVAWVHGLTVGEFAHMINEEGWLGDGLHCDVLVVACEGYTHETRYRLPVPPSPNLPNQLSVYLYPSLAFFEGTGLSVGRGTDTPFQVVGGPWVSGMPFSFVPGRRIGAQDPPHRGKRCYGLDLRGVPEEELAAKGRVRLEYLVSMYRASRDKKRFFIPFFDKLVGNATLRWGIEGGQGESELREQWAKGLREYRLLRARYLLYADSEQEREALARITDLGDAATE